MASVLLDFMTLPLELDQYFSPFFWRQELLCFIYFAEHTIYLAFQFPRQNISMRMGKRKSGLMPFGLFYFQLLPLRYFLLDSSYKSNQCLANQVQINPYDNRFCMFLFYMFYAQFCKLLSFHDFIILNYLFRCRMNLTDMAECGASEKPSLVLALGNVIIYCLGGVLVSSWVWTSASLNIWRRNFKK